MCTNDTLVLKIMTFHSTIDLVVEPPTIRQDVKCRKNTKISIQSETVDGPSTDGEQSRNGCPAESLANAFRH